MSLIFKFKASMTSSIGSLQRHCNFDVSQYINSKFSDMGYFDLFCQKCYYDVIQALKLKINDVIMGNIKCLVTAIFQDKKFFTNFASWGILMQIF